MLDSQTEEQPPVVYFPTLVCNELTKLEEVSCYLFDFVETVPSLYNVSSKNCGQLTETEVWGNFSDAVTDITLPLKKINPANRPYDFGWCEAALVLFCATKEMKQATCDLDILDDLHIGTSKINDDTFEGAQRFKALMLCVEETERVMLQTLPNQRIPALDSFNP